jgi:hypothetical protein
MKALSIWVGSESPFANLSAALRYDSLYLMSPAAPAPLRMVNGTSNWTSVGVAVLSLVL